MSTGVREVEALFTRVPILELTSWSAGALISTGVLDLVDFIPAKRYRVFNPGIAPPIAGSAELPFPAVGLGQSQGAFPDPRFVAHWFIAGDFITRDSVAPAYMELTFTTSCFDLFPQNTQFPLAVIPWVGLGAPIQSMAGGFAQAGEFQSGQIVIPGRYLMVTARFTTNVPGGSFRVGVYLAPVTG